MKWLLLLAGLLVGGAMGEFPGAILGVLVAAALVAWINKGKSPQTPSGDATTPEPGALSALDSSDPLSRRVAALEAEVMRLRLRVEQLSSLQALPALQTSDITAETPLPERQSPESTTEVDPQPVPDASLVSGPAPGPAPRPGLVVRAVTAIRAWLFGGNTVARLGVLVLFLGLSFLAKYAVDHDLLPAPLRIGLIAMVALVLLITGWRLRLKAPAFAMLLQGTAVAALYLDVFAALRLYQLVPQGLAFGLCAAICAFSAVLAVRQNAPALAVLGAGGGFLAPILVSTGSGNHVALFAYYLLLNLGIAAIALTRSWRKLYLVGFFFTFVIGGLWGYRFYRPEFYASVQPFLAAFVLLFIAIVVIEARKSPTRLAHGIDGTLVFGPPLVGFTMQAALVRNLPWAAAWSALAFGALYLLLGLALRRSPSLGRVFPAIGLGFLTLAIPLAFDARVTSAVWALEGAGVLWFGLRHGRWLPVLTGWVLQLVAALLLLERIQGMSTTTAFLNARWIGIILIAGAALYSAWLLRQAELPEHPRLSSVLRKFVSPAMLAWGLLGWLGGTIAEFEAWTWLTDASRFTATLLLLALTAAALLQACRRADWPAAGLASQGLLPLLLLLAFAQAATTRHPSQAWAGVGWLAALAVHERVLRAPVWPLPWALSIQHATRLILAVVLLAWQTSWALERLTTASAWALAGWGGIVALALALLHARGLQTRWPIAARRTAYRPIAASGLALLAMGWLIASSASAQSLETGLRYLPLLNPVDLGILGTALALFVWWRDFDDPPLAQPGVDTPPSGKGAVWRAAAVGLSLFIAINAIVLRTVAHYAALPYDLDRLADSALAQTAVSLLWSLCALATMVFGARTLRRHLWLTGAVLLALVVGKLFLVDLSNWSGLTRVVSFLGVGGLMLVIGYLAPMPPAARGPSPKET